MSESGRFGPKEVAKVDPFPEIDSALLNSADIDEYASKLDPPLFFPYQKTEGLKPATYEIKFEGDIYWWPDEKSFLDRWDPSYEEHAFETKLCHRKISNDDHFDIPANSIVFVSPKTYFRVPPFLALRFNLHIKLVHRGLLLGTGPLVDPGFAGQLLIPVHNLTSHPVVIKANQGFIWVEITKLSKLRQGKTVKEFDSNKNARSAKDYFQSANSLNPIVSTLHVTTEKLKNLVRWTRTFTAIGAVVFIMSLVSVLWGGWSLIRDTHSSVAEARREGEQSIEAVRKENAEIKLKLNTLQAELDLLKQKSVTKTAGSANFDNQKPR